MVAEIYNALHKTSLKEILWPLTYYTDILLGVKKIKQLVHQNLFLKVKIIEIEGGQINLVQCFRHKIVKKRRDMVFSPKNIDVLLQINDNNYTL